MKILLTIALVLMATVAMAEDVIIKDVPSECVARIKGSAQRIIESFEESQLKTAVTLLAEGDTAGTDLIEEVKIATDKYRDSNDLEQKWNAYKVEVIDAVNWSDVEPIKDEINWTDTEIIKEVIK